VCETVFKFLGLPSQVTFYKKLLISNPQSKLIEKLKKELD